MGRGKAENCRKGFFTDKGHFLRCVLKLKQNFKIIKRNSDNSSGKTHFSCECIFTLDLPSFLPWRYPVVFTVFTGRGLSGLPVVSVGRGVQPCCAGLLTILQLDSLLYRPPTSASSARCPSTSSPSMSRFCLDDVDDNDDDH